MPMSVRMEKTHKIRGKSGYHHGDLRAELVEATRRLVEEKGPDHFSVSQACRVAGVSTAAPYRHFRDKDEMIAAVTAEGMHRHYTQMLASLDGVPEGSLARIEALGRVYVSFAQAEPGVFRLIFGSCHDLEALGKHVDGEVAPFDVVKREVASVLGRAHIDEDVTRRAFLLWTFVHGLSFLLIDDKVHVAEMPIDLEALLAETARRVMSD